MTVLFKTNRRSLQETNKMKRRKPVYFQMPRTNAPKSLEPAIFSAEFTPTASMSDE